jgi:hypothetical protein
MHTDKTKTFLAVNERECNKYGMVVMLSGCANKPAGKPARRQEWPPHKRRIHENHS